MMTNEDVAAPELSLNEVKERIEAWRNSRTTRRPMPEELWAAAANLSKQYSIHQIVKALRLNYSALRQRVHPDDPPGGKKQLPAFIELGIGKAPSMSECIVEMEDGRGGKMRMRFYGKTDFDLLELGKAFWSKGA